MHSDEIYFAPDSLSKNCNLSEPISAIQKLITVNPRDHALSAAVDVFLNLKIKMTLFC